MPAKGGRQEPEAEMKRYIAYNKTMAARTMEKAQQKAAEHLAKAEATRLRLEKITREKDAA